MSDLLDALLNDDGGRDPADRPHAPWKWNRRGVQIQCQGLFTEEIREIRKKATRPTFDLKTKERGERFDNDMFNDELILACTPEAPWTDERVRKHYDVVEAAAAMRKALRHPADFGAVLTHCMELCGLTDDEPTPEGAVKNA